MLVIVCGTVQATRREVVKMMIVIAGNPMYLNTDKEELCEECCTSGEFL